MRQSQAFRKLVEKVFPGFSCIFLLLNPTLILAQPSGDGWQLKFADDFNNSNLDTSKWTPCYWWGDSDGCTNGSAGDLQWFQSDEVSVQNGILRLRAQKRQSNGKEYTSGMVSSHDKFSFKYGYVEMRAKVPKGNGFWPDFWLLSQNKNWPPELDIAEFVGSNTNNVHQTLHYDKNGHQTSSGSCSGADFSAGYHTYAVEWSPDKIVWYADGKQCRRYTGEGIPTEPMYVAATLAIGSAWTVGPDNSTPLPNFFDIDYIKVWQQGASTKPNVSSDRDPKPSDSNQPKTVSEDFEVEADRNEIETKDETQSDTDEDEPREDL